MCPHLRRLASPLRASAAKAHCSAAIPPALSVCSVPTSDHHPAIYIAYPHPAFYPAGSTSPPRKSPPLVNCAPARPRRRTLCWPPVTALVSTALKATNVCHRTPIPDPRRHQPPRRVCSHQDAPSSPPARRARLPDPSRTVCLCASWSRLRPLSRGESTPPASSSSSSSFSSSSPSSAVSSASRLDCADVPQHWCRATRC